MKKEDAINLKERILLKYLAKTGIRSFGDGEGVLPKELFYEPKKEPHPFTMISIELINRFNLNSYKKHLTKNSHIQFISHPKMLTTHNLKIFRKYLQYASHNYTLKFDLNSFLTA